MKRFNLHAKTHEDAITYIKNRFLQIAHTRTILTNIVEISEGIWATFEHNENTYYSLYLLDQYRSHDKYYELWMQKCDEHGYEIKMLITTACSMTQYFRHKQIPYIIVNGLINTVEYSIIENIYGDMYAKRSGIYYMNHIDEGLYILSKLDTSLDAKLGYIIHPIFNTDEELKRSYNHTSLNKLSPQSIINAIEFRNIINDYSSYRTITDVDEIRISPLKDVNYMITADIIQMRKDFEIYHLGIHERSKEIMQYFKNWLERLNISEFLYQTIKEEIILLNSELKLVHK